MAVKQLKIKRVYEDVDAADGVRILVDRLWPRGINREKARIDHWLKEVAPSTELRKWYNHDISRWEEFKNRYYEELEKLDEPVRQLRKLVEAHNATLLYSTRAEKHNNAVALLEFLLTEGNARTDI